MDTGSRLCKSANEDIIQIMASCPMSVCYYVPLRDDVIAKIVYNALIHTKIHHTEKKSSICPLGRQSGILVEH